MNGLGRDQSRDSKHSIENMKRIYAVMLGVSLSVGAMAQGTLAFDANAGVMSKMTVYDARDRDTAFPVPVNFATKLQNAGKNVNFLLAWNRPHSGDYALDELFAWIADIVKK